MSGWQERKEARVSLLTHRLLPTLGRSTAFMGTTVLSWLRPRKGQPEVGEFAGRLLALAFPAYVALYLTADRPWLWGVYGGLWLLGCLALRERRGGSGNLEKPPDKRARWRRQNDETAPRAGGVPGARSSERRRGPPGNDHEAPGIEKGLPSPAAGRKRTISIPRQRFEGDMAPAVPQGRESAHAEDPLADGQIPGTEDSQANEPPQGELPPVGKCDLKDPSTDARVGRHGFCPKNDLDGATRPCQQPADDFERRLPAPRERGQPSGSEASRLEHLQTEVTRLKERAAARDESIRDLDDFRTRAVSQLAAQHEEIARLRRQVAEASGTSNVLRPPGTAAGTAPPGPCG